jgi:hypothetical protein
MTKAPHRPVFAPDEGGASPFDRPRGADGRFIKRDDAAPAIVTIAPPTPEKAPARKRAATPAQLVTRVTRAIERELSEIEDIVGGKRTEADKRARTLASLARTLTEVTRLRSAANEAKPEHDDDAVPRDLDEFRETLERRLAQMAEQRQGESDRGDDAP